MQGNLHSHSWGLGSASAGFWQKVVLVVRFGPARGAAVLEEGRCGHQASLGWVPDAQTFAQRLRVARVA